MKKFMTLMSAVIIIAEVTAQDNALEYKSYFLLSSMRLTARLRCQGYKACPFYGFNGNESVYRTDWEDEESSNYKTRMFHRIEKKNLEFTADLQDTIGNLRFMWQRGWNFRPLPWP